MKSFDDSADEVRTTPLERSSGQGPWMGEPPPKLVVAQISQKRLILYTSALGLIVLISSLFTIGSFLDANWQPFSYLLTFTAMLTLTCAHGFILYFRSWKRRGRPGTATVESRLCTVLPNKTALLVVLMLVWSCLVVIVGLISLSYARDSNPVPAVISGALAVAASSLIIEWITGRIVVGYVALNTDGIKQRGRTYEAFISWDHVGPIMGFVPGTPGFLIVGQRGAVVHQRRTAWWRIEAYNPGSWILIDPMWSALPPDLVRDIVSFYADHPEYRHELGTEATERRFSKS